MKPTPPPLPTFCLICFLVLPAVLNAQEWTRFRGPNGSGLNANVSIPAVWTASDYRWKIALPAGGHSSPVLWGQKLFITCAEDASARRMVLCINSRDGSLLWKREFESHSFHQHGDNSYASATPAVDSEHVYVCWNTPEEFTLLALNHDGSDGWKADLGPFVSQHGGGNSPIVVGDAVLLGDDNEGKQSFLYGFDRHSGKVIWQLPRQSDKFSAATPCVIESGGNPPLAVFTSKAHGMTALDPVSGKQIWELPGLFDLRTVSSPVTGGGLVFATCGEGGGGHLLVAVRPALSDRPAEVAWKTTLSTPYVPTPLLRGDLLFYWSDGGTVSCVRATTGEKLWQERVGGSYYASPVCAGDTLFNMTKKGEVVALAASDKFQLLGRNPLDPDGKCHSTPALANGDLYLRTFSHLICISGRPSPK